MVPTTSSKTKQSPGTSILNRRLNGAPVLGSTPTTPRVQQPLSQLQPSATSVKRPATRATVKATTLRPPVVASRIVRRPAPSSQTQATKGGAPPPATRDLGSASSLESKPAKRSKKLFPSPKVQRKKPSVQDSQDSLCAGGSSESMLSVHEELTVTKKEKSALEKRVKQMQQEYSQEMAHLRTELASLQERSTEMDQANSALRARLHNVAHSPLSDTEKQQLLQQHNAANPISTSPDVFSPSGDMEVSCTTPDWDNKSGSSEVSVACLQDRIMQMEETHYSTNEELQATLQELADLQTQLTELQSDNERLLDEKNVLLESLCRQTEKLEDSRTKVDTLQELLLREGQGEVVCTEREQKLVDLLKSSQEERETLLSKQDELNSQLSSLRETSSVQENEVSRLRDRVDLLQSAVDAAHKERAVLDRELACAKQDSSSRQIEISRLATLLENARAKIEELEATRELGDKTEMEEILDGVRKEKDLLESQVASLQEQLSRSQVQVTRLREQTQHLQEECKVTRNNAKSQVGDLEYERDNLKQEVKELSADLQSLKETASELQVQCQCHLEDKRQLKSLLSERQRDLAECERKLQEQGEELEEEKKLRLEETVEWSKFQSDLLMAVRVANDFKTEAQHELEKLVLENKALRDKNRSLDTQLDRQKEIQKLSLPAVVKLAKPTPLKRGHQVSQLKSSRNKRPFVTSLPNLAKIAEEVAENDFQDVTPVPAARDRSQSDKDLHRSNEFSDISWNFKDISDKRSKSIETVNVHEAVNIEAQNTFPIKGLKFESLIEECHKELVSSLKETQSCDTTTLSVNSPSVTLFLPLKSSLEPSVPNTTSNDQQVSKSKPLSSNIDTKEELPLIGIPAHTSDNEHDYENLKLDGNFMRDSSKATDLEEENLDEIINIKKVNDDIHTFRSININGNEENVKDEDRIYENVKDEERICENVKDEDRIYETSCPPGVESNDVIDGDFVVQKYIPNDYKMSLFDTSGPFEIPAESADKFEKLLNKTYPSYEVMCLKDLNASINVKYETMEESKENLIQNSDNFLRSKPKVTKSNSDITLKVRPLTVPNEGSLHRRDSFPKDANATVIPNLSHTRNEKRKAMRLSSVEFPDLEKAQDCDSDNGSEGSKYE